MFLQILLQDTQIKCKSFFAAGNTKKLFYHDLVRFKFDIKEEIVEHVCNDLTHIP